MPLARIDEFIAELKLLTKVADIKVVCNQELEYLRNELGIKTRYSEHGYPVGVDGDARRLKTQISAYRNAIKALPTNYRNSTFKIKNGEKIKIHKSLKYFNLADYEKQDVNTRDRSRVREDKINRPSFTWQEVIVKANELIESQSYISKVAGLYLLTGRRHGEILISGVFEKPVIKPKSDFLVGGWLENDIDAASFSGQSKRKGNADLTYNIPLLAPLEVIQEAIAWLRQHKPHTPGQRPKGSRELGEKVRKEFQDTNLIPKPSGKDKYLSPHNLRSAYCAICWKLYRQSEHSSRCTEDLFVKAIMGHIEEGTESAQSYLDYEILD